MLKKICVLTLCLLAPLVAVQVACRQQPPQYKIAQPGYQFNFPRDHAAHPDYKLEWWYYTGHLRAENGRRFGFQLTFFRTGVDPAQQQRDSQWATRDLYFAHFAVTDIDRKAFAYFEKASRGSRLDNAGARSDYYRTWIDDWVAEGLGDFHYLQARTDSLSLNLIFQPQKAPVINGVDGVSMKAENAGSHYFSITRATVQGVLLIDDAPLAVSGQAWLDHEFSTSQLSDDQIGWDWFSIQLDNNEELMVFLLRRRDGTIDPYSSGTYTRADGSHEHLSAADFSIDALATWTSPKSGGTYPAQWRIQMPHLDLDLRVTPAVADQELRTAASTQITYWEGSVEVTGTKSNKPVHGVGYTELTGYAGEIRL